MKNIISKGDLYFSFVLAIYATWFDALRLVDFSLHIGARLVFDYLTWVLLFALILVLVEKIKGEAIFGKRILRFYPWKLATLIATSISLLIGGTYAFIGDTTLTTLRIAVLAIGFIASTVGIMAYLYALVEKEEKL